MLLSLHLRLEFLHFLAAGVRSVTSRAGRPPSTSAAAIGSASSTRSMISTGMTGASAMISSTVRIFGQFALSNMETGVRLKPLAFASKGGLIRSAWE